LSVCVAGAEGTGFAVELRDVVWFSNVSKRNLLCAYPDMVDPCCLYRVPQIFF
jgi:hypothetical protein